MQDLYNLHHPLCRLVPQQNQIAWVGSTACNDIQLSMRENRDFDWQKRTPFPFQSLPLALIDSHWKCDAYRKLSPLPLKWYLHVIYYTFNSWQEIDSSQFSMFKFVKTPLTGCTISFVPLQRLLSGFWFLSSVTGIPGFKTILWVATPAKFNEFKNSTGMFCSSCPGPMNQRCTPLLHHLENGCTWYYWCHWQRCFIVLILHAHEFAFDNLPWAAGAR